MHTVTSSVKEEELGEKMSHAPATRKGRNVQVRSHLVPRDIYPLGLTPAWCPWPPSQEAAAGAKCCCPVLGATHSCCALPCFRVAGFPELRLSSKRPLPDSRVRAAAKKKKKKSPALGWGLTGEDRFAAAAQINWAAWGPQQGLARGHSRCS